jgi:hypothetical protein
MRKGRLLLAVFVLSACLTALAQKSPAKVEASAVWQVSPQFLAAAHTACQKSSPSGFSECMIEQMAKAGAPADAVSFTRELYKQSHGEFGVMSDFQNAGPVACAWISYPLRANTNYGFLLVNGQPPIVKVDLKLLDRKTMEQSFQFQDLKNQFPKVDLWPGDRDGRSGLTRRPGQMTDRNFDAKGTFLGTWFMGLTPRR